MPTIEFSLDHLAALPRPRLSLRTERVGALTRLTARLENDGYLPTHITACAAQKKLVHELHLELALEGAELVEGRANLRVAHLGGRANFSVGGLSSSHFGGATLTHVDEKVWWVRGDGTATVTWWGDRIGRVVASTPLPA